MKYAVVQVLDSVGGIDTNLVACATAEEVGVALERRGLNDWSVFEVVGGAFQRRSVTWVGGKVVVG